MRGGSTLYPPPAPLALLRLRIYSGCPVLQLYYSYRKVSSPKEARVQFSAKYQHNKTLLSQKKLTKNYSYWVTVVCGCHRPGAVNAHDAGSD